MPTVAGTPLSLSPGKEPRDLNSRCRSSFPRSGRRETCKRASTIAPSSFLFPAGSLIVWVRLRGVCHDALVFGCYIPHFKRKHAPFQGPMHSPLEEPSRDALARSFESTSILEKRKPRDCVIVAGDLNVQLARRRSE